MVSFANVCLVAAVACSMLPSYALVNAQAAQTPLIKMDVFSVYEKNDPKMPPTYMSVMSSTCPGWPRMYEPAGRKFSPFNPDAPKDAKFNYQDSRLMTGRTMSNALPRLKANTQHALVLTQTDSLELNAVAYFTIVEVNVCVRSNFDQENPLAGAWMKFGFENTTKQMSILNFRDPECKNLTKYGGITTVPDSTNMTVVQGNKPITTTPWLNGTSLTWKVSSTFGFTFVGMVFTSDRWGRIPGINNIVRQSNAISFLTDFFPNPAENPNTCPDSAETYSISFDVESGGDADTSVGTQFSLDVLRKNVTSQLYRKRSNASLEIENYRNQTNVDIDMEGNFNSSLSCESEPYLLISLYLGTAFDDKNNCYAGTITSSRLLKESLLKQTTPHCFVGEDSSSHFAKSYDKAKNITTLSQIQFSDMDCKENGVPILVYKVPGQELALSKQNRTTKIVSNCYANNNMAGFTIERVTIFPKQKAN
jgi:hypothetical protein